MPVFGIAVVPRHGHPHAAAKVVVPMCARHPRAIPHSPGLLDHGVRPEQQAQPDRPPFSCSISAPRWCLAMATPTQHAAATFAASHVREALQSDPSLSWSTRPWCEAGAASAARSAAIFLLIFGLPMRCSVCSVQRAHTLCCHRLTSPRRVRSPSACP